MKKLIYAIACTLAVINDMMTTLSDIEEGFREITEAQSRVTLAKQGEGTNTMQRIKENFQFIQSQMQQNKELINKLKQQVRESSVKGGQLKKIIDNLTQQLETKDHQLQALREELDRKDIHIAELDEKVASLNTNVTSLKEDNEKKEETITSQDKALPRSSGSSLRTAYSVRPSCLKRISTRITSRRSISVSTRRSNSTASQHRS